MGGLGPGIGGLEYVVIGIVALVVVGPERLPGLLRQLGKMVAKARGMANEFRASFDEMARQSELDDLRKEVQALRDGQGPVGQGMVRLGDEANAAFKDIKAELEAPTYVETPPRAVMLDQPEFPEPGTTPPSPRPRSASRERRRPGRDSARRQGADDQASRQAEAAKARRAQGRRQAARAA